MSFNHRQVHSRNKKMQTCTRALAKLFVSSQPTLAKWSRTIEWSCILTMFHYNKSFRVKLKQLLSILCKYELCNVTIVLCWLKTRFNKKIQTCTRALEHLSATRRSKTELFSKFLYGRKPS
jgi:hypothetical protein